MKKLFLLLMIGCSTFFVGCDGADHDSLDDDYCYFILGSQQADQIFLGHCSFTVTFEDEFGNQYPVSGQTGTQIPVRLPKDRCYTAWLLEDQDIGCGGGLITFGVGTEGNTAPAFSYTHFFNGFADGIGLGTTMFSFCLDDECSYDGVGIN